MWVRLVLFQIEGDIMNVKSYEQKMKKFKTTCQNMAQMITLTAKFHIKMENAEEAGNCAKASASYAFHGFTELREE